jgi:hypothetical protein
MRYPGDTQGVMNRFLPDSIQVALAWELLVQRTERKLQFLPIFSGQVKHNEPLASRDILVVVGEPRVDKNRLVAVARQDLYVAVIHGRVAVLVEQPRVELARHPIDLRPLLLDGGRGESRGELPDPDHLR